MHVLLSTACQIRDQQVLILWENILDGFQSNFYKHPPVGKLGLNPHSTCIQQCALKSNTLKLNHGYQIAFHDSQIAFKTFKTLVAVEFAYFSCLGGAPAGSPVCPNNGTELSPVDANACYSFFPAETFGLPYEHNSIMHYSPTL